MDIWAHFTNDFLLISITQLLIFVYCWFYHVCLKRIPGKLHTSVETLDIQQAGKLVLANTSEKLVGQVENRPGQVEFCIGYIRHCSVQASAKKF